MRLKPKVDEGTENNIFWITMTDLMTGLVLVFIVMFLYSYISSNAEAVKQKIAKENATKAMQESLVSKNINATIDPHTGIVKISDLELFEIGSYNLSPKGRAYLNKLVPIYIDTIFSKKDLINGIENIVIQGHTDSQSYVGVKNPDLIKSASQYFGAQCIVIAIDAKRVDGDFYVHINAGKKNTGIKLIDWAKQVEQNGAGEILLTSMDADGTQNGFDIEMTKLISNSVKIPVIASGGAGADIQHFTDIFNLGNADAALAASIFHFDTLPIPTLKDGLKRQGLNIR